MWAEGPEQALGAQPGLDRRRHAVRRVLGALDRIPEVMGDELQEQCFRRRPGEGVTGGEAAPGLEVTEVGGQRAERILAHALLRQMLECGDVVVGQQRDELVAPVEGQDGAERVEFLGAAQDRILADCHRTVSLCHKNAFPFGTFLTVFTRMPKPQHVDRRLPDLIPYFVMANENSPNLSRVEFLQPFTDARLLEQAHRSACQRLQFRCR